MLNNKGTNIFSEINSFFPENDNKKAINSIMDVARNLRISSKSLSLESNANCKFTRLQVFELLLVFPIFMVKNAFVILNPFLVLRLFFFVALTARLRPFWTSRLMVKKVAGRKNLSG